MSAPTTATAELRIDWSRCDGRGVCAALLPERIGFDEWGFPIIASTTADRDARRAVAACPNLALRISR